MADGYYKMVTSFRMALDGQMDLKSLLVFISDAKANFSRVSALTFVLTGLALTFGSMTAIDSVLGIVINQVYGPGPGTGTGTGTEEMLIYATYVAPFIAVGLFHWVKVLWNKVLATITLGTDGAIQRFNEKERKSFIKARTHAISMVGEEFKMIASGQGQYKQFKDVVN